MIDLTKDLISFTREHPTSSSHNKLKLIRILVEKHKNPKSSANSKDPSSNEESSNNINLYKSLREILQNHIITSNKLFDESLQTLVKFSFWLSQSNSELLPMKYSNHILDDIYECIPLEDIRIFFNFLEEELMSLEIVKKSTNSMTLLKICNSLLKRLSKSTHNELRGRVHML